MHFLSSADCFLNHLFQKILLGSNSLDPDQTRHFVEPYLNDTAELMLDSIYHMTLKFL